MIQFKPFERSSSAYYLAASNVWNAASTAEFTISPTFIGHNTQAFTGVSQEGRMAFDGRRAVGFVLASHAEGLPEVVSPETGFIELIAVHPDYQRRSIGGQLLAYGEDWLRRRGVKEIKLGGGLVPFAPGLPDELQTHAFFARCGFQPQTGNPHQWDVARTMHSGLLLERPEPSFEAVVRPARAYEQDKVDDFFTREFPGRWQYELREYLRLGGRISDVLLLLLNDQVQGFAWMTLDDSPRLLERFHPERLPDPWAQVGPLGIAKALRGQGWGRYLMLSVLQHLRMRNIRGIVIDCTTLLEFYERFGFTPYRRYTLLSKK